MADQQKVIIVDPVAQAREQFNAEMAEIRKNPLDKAKVAGGYYVNADGEGAHDANGNPVAIRGEDNKAASEAQKRAEARREATEGLETVAMDSPEELADRLSNAPQSDSIGMIPTSGGNFLPPAIEPGTVLPDGTTSQPDDRKKSTRKGKK